MAYFSGGHPGAYGCHFPVFIYGINIANIFTINSLHKPQPTSQWHASTVTDYASIPTLSFWSEPLAEDLRRFFTGRLKCRETAADLTHETYLRLHRLSLDKPPDNARAMAFHIAVHLAVDYQRKAAVRNRFGAEIDMDTQHETLAGNDASANPERILMSRQKLERLQQALDELPANCRTAFILHSLEGLGYAEIAARMGISKSMVGKHLAKAMTHCAERLDAQ